VAAAPQGNQSTLIVRVYRVWASGVEVKQTLGAGRSTQRQLLLVLWGRVKVPLRHPLSMLPRAHSARGRSGPSGSRSVWQSWRGWAHLPPSACALVRLQHTLRTALRTSCFWAGASARPCWPGARACAVCPRPMRCMQALSGERGGGCSALPGKQEQLHVL